jgi:enterochelin esterase-like enzyme
MVSTACASFEKRLEYRSIESAYVHQRMSYAVYAPPGFRREEALPLVVFLHGGGDGPDCFDRAELGKILDDAVASGRAPRAVIVVPQGDLGFWENWRDGSLRYRDWVMREVVPLVRADYGTRPCPEGCHVMGISMGGAGALRFALFERSFSSVTSISGPILDADQMVEFSESFMIGLLVPVRRIWGPIDRSRIEREDPYRRWRSPGDLGGMRVMLAWGDADREGIMRSNRKFSDHLRERNVEHEELVFSGGHRWTSWAPVIEKVLRFQIGG